jgi:hypothetical protein
MATAKQLISYDVQRNCWESKPLLDLRLTYKEHFLCSCFLAQCISHGAQLQIGHKYNNVQADGGVALRVDLFESNKQKKQQN